MFFQRSVKHSEETALFLEHLDNNNIDVNFKSADSGHYKLFKNMEKRYKFLQQMKFKRKDVIEVIDKVNEIKVKPDDSWLENYRNDNEEPQNDGTVIEENPDILALNERFKNEIANNMIKHINQMTDEERMQDAMTQLNELHNIINNNK